MEGGICTSRSELGEVNVANMWPSEGVGVGFRAYFAGLERDVGRV